MKIRVLGPGCSRCRMLYAEAEKAIASSGLTVTLEKVEEVEEIMKYNAIWPSVLVVDEEVKSNGRIPPSCEIASWITAAAAKASA